MSYGNFKRIEEEKQNRSYTSSKMTPLSLTLCTIKPKPQRMNIADFCRSVEDIPKLTHT